MTLLPALDAHALAPGFTGSPLDRLEAMRDPDTVARLAADPAARLLDLADYVPRTERQALVWKPLPALPLDELVLLGRIDGPPLFAHIDPAATAARRAPELFAIIAALPAGEAGTYAAARSLLDWHARHRFCANCGTATAPFRAGWGRRCPACATEHFPRTDPVVIMLAEHDDSILLGRQAAFPAGRYSALAGFVEVGESLEAAVARELKEEACVTATSVRYLASQPWPFPSQLMLACIAPVADRAITLDRTELEDAKWVTREEVADALALAPGATFLPPPEHAIANTLLRAWLAGV